MKAILPFRENGDKTPLDLNILVSKNGIFDIWRALSVLTLLNVTSYKTRVGSVVKILSKDKDSKLPNNRRGRIVQMDEQTNSASVVLADGEIVEGMALDQLDLEYEESVISEAIDSSVLKVLFDNVASLLPLDLPSSTIVEATLRYRLMAYVCSIINNVSNESSEIPVEALYTREIFKVASSSVLIQNEFPSFEDLSHKIEELTVVLRDIYSTYKEINDLTSPKILHVSGKHSTNGFEVKSTGALLQVDKESTYRVNNDLGEEWECPQCESLNETDVLNCEMCDFERPKLAGIVIGEVWPQSLTMDLFHVPGMGRKSYTATATSELMNEGYGVNWHGQATLTNTISAQPTASFEFEITTLDAHFDTSSTDSSNYIRCGLMKENIDVSEELEASDMFAWDSHGKMFKATNRAASEAKETQKLTVSYMCNVDDTIKQQQSVLCEDISGTISLLRQKALSVVASR